MKLKRVCELNLRAVTKSLINNKSPQKTMIAFIMSILKFNLWEHSILTNQCGRQIQSGRDELSAPTASLILLH